MKRIFISSVQKEFAQERAALRDYLHADPLLRRFFDVFVFEDLPATDRRTDQVYLHEVAACDIYLGLFGNDYGFEDAQGISPTEREFDRASQLNKPRLVYVKGDSDANKHPKMRALIARAGGELIRRRFADSASLHPAIYASLVAWLVEQQLIVSTPFDATPNRGATLADLQPERMAHFIRDARYARGFPLPESAKPLELLTHLNLVAAEQHPTNAALLLFAEKPQRFFITSEIKCAHFHGTTVAKPIPSYQVYKGTVFELIDQAADFVLAKIALRVGTREHSTQVPVSYELPQEAVREAITNAVAHRDYTSNASVQVMLFADRLEIWNPGSLPASLTLEKLRHPHASAPHNPLLAEPLYLTKYIERMGTGTGDMIARCVEAGLPEPQFRLDGGCFVLTLYRPATSGVTQQVTQQVSQQVSQLLALVRGEMTRAELMAAVGLKDRVSFSRNYLDPALADAWLEMTQPDSPKSPTQKYRLTPKGQQLIRDKKN